jgi:hypothetical protein
MAMNRFVSLRVLASVAALAGGIALSLASPEGRQLPLPAIKDSGEAVFPAFEGWYQNKDGSYNLLLGYYNRNMKQTLEIPVGPNNRVEPGGPDLGQPTYFQLRRGWGVFAIKVPKDFGSEKRYTWTIVANGKTASVPVGLIKDYQIEPFKDEAEGNTPPVLKFSPTGKPFQGPPIEIAHTLSGNVGQPVTLEVITTDDMHTEEGENPAVAGRIPRLVQSWHKHRGPAGEVKFSEQRPKIGDGGKSTTTATFPVAGEYILRAQANDNSGEGGGGFQCCWTNAYVKVTIK